MATQTLNLNDTIPQEEEVNTIKTLDPTLSPAEPADAKPDLHVDPSGTDGARKEGEESKSVAAATVGSSAGSNNDNSVSVTTDVQKKIQRAERFGMPVQLSEQEKRNSRAERFGTGTTLNGSDVLRSSEELKRKARAERFGLAVPSGPSDEEAKKKARLARFTTTSKKDTLEEDKRKAREIRFADPPSSSLSQDNGKGNVELKATIAGKASGGA